nr:protein PFC0760c-like [Onthophagus taurus]
MKFEVLYFWVFVNFVKLTSGEESFCVLNGKKSVNYVSDKFISFVVDPTVLFTDLNISETAHELGKFLSPSYVRIAGFSTKYLEFSENEEDYQPNLSNESNLVYTPKSSNITFEVYKENLKKLKSTLDEFSLNKNDWKIISNDLNLYSESSFDIRNKIDELNQIVSAVFWENGHILPVKSEIDKLLTSPSKASIPIWTSLPKSENPITFSSTLNLAKQISTAAILGYEVVFRPPRLYELIRDTTNYWYIYLHKKLMGRNVLEIKPSTGFERLEKWDQIFISAHCTKNQNSFSRRGAITISIINNKTEEHLISLKLPLNVVNLKHIEVQSYILTSDNENSTFAYLNNKPLSMDLLRQNQVLIPKIRRARLTKSLTLTTPPKSIGFFVLPDARIPICINDEDETNLIMEEIEEEENSVNQFVPKTQINSRNNDLKSTKLIDLYNQLKNELEIDEKFYGNNINKKLFIKDNFQDVSSREIEEVILKITKKMKENRERNFHKRDVNFYDEFGEEVKVIDKHQNTDLTDPNKNILNSLVTLDDRIANEENLDFLDNEDYTQYDEDNSKIRKKRQQKQFTESDIAHYRQLMNSNIRHMRENIMKNKLKLKTSKKEQTDLSQRINRLKEAVDMVQRSNNKDDDNSLETTKGIKKIKKLNLNPVRFNNIKLNNDKLNNIKLAQHKLNQNENDLKKKDEIDDETKELISKIKNELRNRKPRGTMENWQVAPFNERTKLLLRLSKQINDKNNVIQNETNTQLLTISNENYVMCNSNVGNDENTNLAISNVEICLAIPDAPIVTSSETGTSSVTEHYSQFNDSDADPNCSSTSSSSSSRRACLQMNPWQNSLFYQMKQQKSI